MWTHIHTHTKKLNKDIIIIIIGRTNAGTISYYTLILSAFGSGELKGGSGVGISMIAMNISS